MERKKIYESKEWKELDKTARACLLLVAEGLKPGTTFGSLYRTNIEKVLEKLTLPYLPPKWSKGWYGYTVAKEELILSKYIRNELDGNKPVKQATYENGRFYGFPECCIESFTHSYVVKPESTRDPQKPGFLKGREEFEHEQRRRPEELNYLIPGMALCSPDCQKALSLLRSYREVIQAHDREAGEELKSFNRYGYKIINKSIG